MEHIFDYFGGCPGGCPSTSVKLIAYCGSNAVYIMCQECDAQSTSTFEAEEAKLKPRFKKGETERENEKVIPRR